jgi:hypothetical protein
MPAQDNDGAGSWKLKFSTAVFCVLLSVGAGALSWTGYDAGLVPIYRPPGGVDRVGAVQAYVASESFVTSSEMRIVESGDAPAPFLLSLTVTSRSRLRTPPTVAVRFIAPLQVSISAPVPANKYRPSTSAWFGHRLVSGGQVVVVSQPPQVAPARVSLENVDGAPARRSTSVPWYTFDGRKLVVRIAGRILNGIVHTREKARTTYGLPAAMPTLLSPRLGETATAQDVAGSWRDDAPGPEPKLMATRTAVELSYLTPANGSVGGSLTNRIPADARVDYVAPSPPNPDVLRWSAEPSIEPMLVRLSYVSRSAEQSGQSRTFLAGVGLGFAVSVFLLGLEIGPWRQMHSMWTRSYRAALADRSTR